MHKQKHTQVLKFWGFSYFKLLTIKYVSSTYALRAKGPVTRSSPDSNCLRKTPRFPLWTPATKMTMVPGFREERSLRACLRNGRRPRTFLILWRNGGRLTLCYPSCKSERSEPFPFSLREKKRVYQHCFRRVLKETSLVHFEKKKKNLDLKINQLENYKYSK